MSKPWNPEREKVLHFPYADYYLEEEGRRVRVWFPTNDPFQSPPEGMEVYDPNIHSDKKNWLCPGKDCCSARLSFVPKDEKTGRVLHLRTNPDSIGHREACEFREVSYDSNKGFLAKGHIRHYASPVSFETQLSAQREKFSKYYERHTVLRDQFAALARMERVKFWTSADVIDLYKKAGIDRALKSVFNIDGVYLREDEYLIRRSLPGEDNRYAGLMDRLREARGQAVPCSMQLRNPHVRTDLSSKSQISVRSEAVFLYREHGETGQNGPVHYMVPNIVSTLLTAGFLKEAFENGKNIEKNRDVLVTGYVYPKSSASWGDHVLHHVEIEIRDRGQVEYAAMADLMPVFLPDPELSPKAQFALPFRPR